MDCKTKIKECPPLRFRWVSIFTFLLYAASCLMPAECRAQTWDEWFQQKKTQKAYLIKQIALLKVYLGYVKEGITIAHNGYNTIQNIKEGDFNLHRDFFGTLKQVNPHIKNSARVADIIAYQVFLINQLREVNTYCRNNKHFTPEEVRYVADIYANMLLLCDANISELLMIITVNQTQMTDDERLQRVERLYEDTVDKKQFVTAFEQDIRFLATAREREHHNITTITNYYDR